MRKKVTNQKLGFALAACAALFWSTIGVLGKFAYDLGADPVTIITFRAVIAVTAVGGVIAVKRRGLFKIKRGDIPFFVGYGFFGVALNYLGYFYALRFTTVATAETLLYTYPAVVVVLAFFLFHESITAQKIVALVLTFLGVLLTAFGFSSKGSAWDPRGLLFGLLAGFANAVYTLAGKRAQDTYSALTVLFYSFLFGALTLGGFYLTDLGTKVNISLEGLILVAVIALVPTLMGYGLYNLSLRLTEAGKSSITASIEPAAAIFLAYIILGEMPSFVQLGGTLLILLGVTTLQIRK